ncbi:AzlD family protein [Acinetobacter sp. MYb177]|uniref:AzlD family protein n=1 Tax=Acinetobacter TaxID=469 RepID=UPI0012500538|nr:MULTISPECIES: AzlD family protein [Acinetobacter]MDH0834535.1 AzlD family protein [Acinetobacter johnsonii]MDH0838091.1 AzlD family protein [Acinetobacter johnsonii]QPF34079.1 AzlD family protein [Acinetobacter johnsonii]UNT42334.1 AzlD family protein [Acinetobacter sp. LUNF3]
MIHSTTLVAILLVAATTYLTRILGYVLLKNKTLSNKQRKILEVVPGCVLISVIAPYFVKDNVADLLAIAITLIAASRFSLLPTVVISMLSAALLRTALI